MAEQRIEPVGCLGRVLTILGVLWLGVVVFAGIFGLRDNVGSLGALIGSTLPALLLIGAGRALSRRAKARAQTEPVLPAPAPATTEKRVPTMRVESSAPAPPPAEPVPRRVPEPEVPSLPVPPLPVPPPKSSKEMIEEARKRWGTDSRSGKDAL